MGEAKTTAAITVEALLAAGYREFAPDPSLDKADRMFQRCMYDAAGDKRYFVTFRMWDLSRYGQPVSFDADVVGDTDTGGHFWLTIKESTIEGTERRAEIMWQAAGAIFYEKGLVDAE